MQDVHFTAAACGVDMPNVHRRLARIAIGLGQLSQSGRQAGRQSVRPLSVCP